MLPRGAAYTLGVSPSSTTTIMSCNNIHNTETSLPCILQEDFAHLRQLCYSQINAAVICFSVSDRKSFDNVKDKWIDEVRRHCRNVPVVLMGTQTDKREDTKPPPQLRAKSSKSVSMREGMKMAAHLKAVTYVECSAFDRESVKSVFNDAVVAALGLGSVAPTVQCAGCTIL